MTERMKVAKKKTKIKWHKKMPHYGISPLNRFRHLVRRVINNLTWLSDTTEIEPNLDNPVLSEYIEKHRRGSMQVLFRSDKYILHQPPEKRTHEQIKNIADKLMQYPILKRLSYALLLLVSRYFYYSTHRNPVTLFKAGCHLQYVYILILGKCIAHSTNEVDEKLVKEREKIYEGTMIGEFAVIFEIPTVALVKTLSTTEWMIIDKMDFNLHISPLLRDSYISIENALTKFDLFNRMGVFEKRFYVSIGRYETFEKDTVLTSYEDEERKLQRRTYFLVEGGVTVYKCLRMKRDENLPYPHLALEEDQDAPREADSPEHERTIVKIMDIKRGGVIGCGTELESCCFAVSSKVNALILPLSLLRKYNYEGIANIKESFDKYFPSKEIIFKEITRKRRLTSLRDQNLYYPSTLPSSVKTRYQPIAQRGALMKSENRKRTEKAIDPRGRLLFSLDEYDKLPQYIINMAPHLPLVVKQADLKKKESLIKFNEIS